MNFNRFLTNMNEFARIGEIEKNGITRLAFSEEYFKAISELNKYASSLGLETKVDNVGNLFIVYNPKKSDDYLMIGSHMDTVKSGGLYDGALGVIAGLEILETLKERNIETNLGIILVAFNAEEGSEMGGTFGSRTIVGRNDLKDDMLASKIKKYGLTIKDLENSIIDFEKIVGFIELHIEQGGVLENQKVDIGVVDGIVGITRYNIVLKGEANHAGTTPMNLRNDPVRKLPAILNKLYELSTKYEDPFVMTIGDIQISPGMYNVIPDNVEILIEVRDMNQNNIMNYFENVEKFLKSNYDYYELNKNIEKPSVKLDEEYMEIVSKVCQDLGYSYKIMSSGAGHDTKEISHLIPASLIFVPSVGGISHSPKEYTRKINLEKGISVLYNTVRCITERRDIY